MMNYSLMNNVKSPTKDEVRVKILIVGDPSVGKTSLLNTFCNERFSESYTKTIGVDLKVKCFQLSEADNNMIKLLIWDQGCDRERFGRSTSSYYQGANYIIIVYDVTNIETFENITYWINEIKKHNPAMMMRNILILGNKSDLIRQRNVSFKEGKDYAEANGNMYFETSIKQPSTIEKAFILLLNSNNKNTLIRRKEYIVEKNGKLLIQLNPKRIFNNYDNNEGDLRILTKMDSLKLLLSLIFTLNKTILLQFDDNIKTLTISQVIFGYCGYFYNYYCNTKNISILYQNIEKIEFRHNNIHINNIAHYYPVLITKQGDIYIIGRSDSIDKLEDDILRLHQFIFGRDNNNYEKPTIELLGRIFSNNINNCSSCTL